MKQPKQRAVNLETICRQLTTEHNFAGAVAALADRLATEAAVRDAAATHILRAFTKKAAELHSRRRVGPHRTRREPRPTSPTADQKVGAIRAEASRAAEIFDRKLRGGRKLGDVHVHELRAIAEASASTATSFLQRGYDDAVETFACVALSNHCISSDPFAAVRDVIKPQVARGIFEQAQLKAAEALRDGSGRLARELVAAAQQVEAAT